MKFNLSYVLMCAAAFCLAGQINAQDVDQESVEAGGESVEMTVIAGEGIGAPMIFSTTESFSGDGAPASRIMMAAPGGSGLSFIGSSHGEDFAMPAPDPFSMLSNPSVQKDLELVGEQRDKVMNMQKKFAQAIQDKLGDLRKGNLDKDRFAGIGEVIQQLREEQKSELEGLLLPHQVDRLKQVALQTHMNQAGTANALVSEQVAETLNITDEQKERLKKRQKELKEKLAKDIEALKDKAKDDLLMELTPDQRSKLKSMTGEKYQPNNKDWLEQFEQRRQTVPRVKRRIGGGNN